MSENETQPEVWLATEDPTQGDLKETEFMGSKKDVQQTKPPEEGDGQDIATIDEEESA